MACEISVFSRLHQQLAAQDRGQGLSRSISGSHSSWRCESLSVALAGSLARLSEASSGAHSHSPTRTKVGLETRAGFLDCHAKRAIAFEARNTISFTEVASLLGSAKTATGGQFVACNQANSPRASLAANGIEIWASAITTNNKAIRQLRQRHRNWGISNVHHTKSAASKALTPLVAAELGISNRHHTKSTASKALATFLEVSGAAQAAQNSGPELGARTLGRADITARSAAKHTEYHVFRTRWQSYGTPWKQFKRFVNMLFSSQT